MTKIEPEQYRMLVAAHELGHVIGCRANGLDVYEIKLSGRGSNTAGIVRWHTPGGIDGFRASMVALLAGRAADLKWCEETGTPAVSSGCSGDMAEYRRMRRQWPRAWGRVPADREIRANADTIIRRQWAHVVRLAPRLAERGRLPSSAR